MSKKDNNLPDQPTQEQSMEEKIKLLSLKVDKIISQLSRRNIKKAG